MLAWKRDVKPNMMMTMMIHWVIKLYRKGLFYLSTEYILIMKMFGSSVAYWDKVFRG